MQKKLSWRGTDFRSPTSRDLGSGISVPVSVSAAWRPGFGYVWAAVSVTVPPGSRYESAKLVPVKAKMVPVTRSTRFRVEDNNSGSCRPGNYPAVNDLNSQY